MQPSFANKFAAFYVLLIGERASAASILPWTATNGQFEDITTTIYTNDMTPTSDLADVSDVTDVFMALGEVTDYTTTSSEHIPSFTPAEAPDVAGLASTIDASSVVVVSTTGTTTPLQYASINTTQLAATGELISSAEITHLNGQIETTIQPTSIKTAPAASIWSPSYSSEGNSVSTLIANTSVGATLGSATLLSADANAFTISMPAASSSTDTKNIAVTTQATTWRGIYKNSFISSTPATLSGGSQSVANISVPSILSVSTESVVATSIQTNSSATTKSAFPLMPSTSPGVTSSTSFSTPLSAATKSFFTSLTLMTSPGTTSSAFSITTPSASLKATSNAVTFATPVSSSSRTIILGKFSSEATPPANNYATTVSAPPAWSGTAMNIFTLSKPVTSLGTTAKVFHVSTPKTSRASMNYFSLCQIICALVLSRIFVYYVS